MLSYKDYTEICMTKLHECLESMECQPILFIGSGVSRRYFGSLSWDELLEKLIEVNPLTKELAYYKQRFSNNIEIGSELSTLYSEWAWGEGRAEFENSFFNKDYNSDIFMKSKISEIISSYTPNVENEIDPAFSHELSLLKEIRPHAIITTNFDGFLELIFPDYHPIIGEKILRAQYTSIGELFKIHGTVEDPSSLIIHEDDYNEFIKRKKYLSAKLLTYFLEHPIIFIGYSVSDSNIKSILSDIDEILRSNDDLVPNVFMVEWRNDIKDDEFLSLETLIKLENNSSIRVNNITTNSFDWVYEALTNENAIENVNPKLLRALLARTYKLVRTDVPKKTIEIDYETLKSALGGDGDINKIFGITTLTNPSALNINFPYILTEVAHELGYSYWSHANDLIMKIQDEKKINIKDSDNKYHICVPTGSSSTSRKYSMECIELLRKVKNGQDYDIHL